MRNSTDWCVQYTIVGRLSNTDKIVISSVKDYSIRVVDMGEFIELVKLYGIGDVRFEDRLIWRIPFIRDDATETFLQSLPLVSQFEYKFMTGTLAYDKRADANKDRALIKVLAYYNYKISFYMTSVCYGTTREIRRELKNEGHSAITSGYKNNFCFAVSVYDLQNVMGTLNNGLCKILWDTSCTTRGHLVSEARAIQQGKPLEFDTRSREMNDKTLKSIIAI